MTIGPKLPPATAMPQGAGLADARPGKRQEVLSGAAVRVTSGAVSSAEGVDPAVEGDLRRDDALGGLFKTAFALPAPEFDEDGFCSFDVGDARGGPCV